MHRQGLMRKLHNICIYNSICSWLHELIVKNKVIIHSIISKEIL